MTQVDFYLIGEANPDSRERIACRLIDKAYKMGRNIYVYVDNKTEARQLDQTLWTFSAGSFIPHELNSGQGTVEATVCIGHQEPPEEFADVLVSLSPEVPGFFSRFERVAEVVGATETEKQQARDRFRFYRDRGYQLQMHKL